MTTVADFTLEDSIYEAFRDAYSYHPSREEVARIAASPEEIEKLRKDVAAAIEFDLEFERQNARKLVEIVTSIAATSNVSFETALRWDMDAHDANNDFEYYLWNYGTSGRFYDEVKGA